MGSDQQKSLLRRSTQLAQETCSSTSVSNSVIAGYAAGISGTIVGHPFDSAKVWLQTNTNSSSIGTQAGTPTTVPSNKTTRSTQVALVTNTTTYAPPLRAQAVAQHVKRLYAGITGPLLTVGIVQSLNFAVYDSTRRMLYGWQHSAHNDLDYLHADSLMNVGVAGGVAGAVLSLITSPMHVVKTQQQIHNISLRQALQENQGRRLFVGMTPHLLSSTIGRAIYLVTYESAKRYASNNNADGHLSLTVRALAAATAGIVSWSLIFPLDSVRSRMYASAGDTKTSVRQVWNQMWRERSLYRGYRMTVLRAGPVAATVLPVYDLTLGYLNEYHR